MIKKMVSVELPEDANRKNSLLVEELTGGEALISGVASNQFLRNYIKTLAEMHNQNRKKEDPEICVIIVSRD